MGKDDEIGEYLYEIRNVWPSQISYQPDQPEILGPRMLLNMLKVSLVCQKDFIFLDFIILPI